MVIPMRVLKRATPTFTTTGDPIILTSTGGGDWRWNIFVGHGWYQMSNAIGAAGGGGLVAGNAFVVYAKRR